MNIQQNLIELSQKNIEQHREALSNILNRQQLDYRIQEEAPSYKNPQGTINYILDSYNDTPSLLLCAHYDAVAGSSGANDNAASVCILIELAVELKKRNVNIRFAFFDGEEHKYSGSRLYTSTINKNSVTGVVNLDMCGYGDSIVINSHGYDKKPVFQNLCNKNLLEKHNGSLVKYLPPSDDISFSSARIPVISISAVPRWDIQYLNALASYDGGFIAHPPEFDMIIEQMEITTTMHGGFRDSVEFVEDRTVNMIYNYLLECITSPIDCKPKRFGLFR